MTDKELGMIKELESQIEQFTNPATAQKVMVSCTDLKPNSPKKKIAQCMKSVVESMDQEIELPIRIKIMENCGQNCACVNHKVIDAAKKRRNSFKSNNAFLESEQQHPMRGTKLLREGNILHFLYTPHEFSDKIQLRCYCGLFRGLPESENVSQTYCACSKAFVTKFWEEVLGKPVSVEIVRTAISGADVCEFKITF
jgi:hypothetical protein